MAKAKWLTLQSDLPYFSKIDSFYWILSEHQYRVGLYKNVWEKFFTLSRPEWNSAHDIYIQ